MKKKINEQKKSIKKEVTKHLKQDIKGYEKERKYLKSEEGEDKGLIKKLKGVKDGKSEKKPCSCHEENSNRKGSGDSKTKSKRAPKVARRK
jgi:hypothetical protein